MKAFKIQIIILLTLGLFSSCENWLDVSPKADVKAEDLFSSERGFSDVLTGVYALMTVPSAYGTELTFGYVDVLAQYYDRISSANHRYSHAVSFEYNETDVQAMTDPIWKVQYKAISNLNSILYFIDDKKELFSSDATYQIYKGEALALRGMLHFDLLRLFGPNPVDGFNELAIPYMTDYTNVAQKQLTVSEVLELVIKDLEQARVLMKEVDPYGLNYTEDYDTDILGTRVRHMNYLAATALLARVQLYAGNKTEALQVAKEIIGEPEADPVSPIVLATESSIGDRIFEDEWLFALQIRGFQDRISPYFGESAVDPGGINPKLLSMNESDVASLYEAVDPTDNDFRLTLWFQDIDNSTVMPSKFLGTQEMPLIRVSELYYIAAECAADETVGLAYLNKIRAKRGLAPLVDISSLQEEIIKEYKKEFVGEGQMFFCYKRLNMPEMGVNLKVTNVTDDIYQLPIPIKEFEYGLIEE